MLSCCPAEPGHLGHALSLLLLSVRPGETGDAQFVWFLVCPFWLPHRSACVVVSCSERLLHVRPVSQKKATETAHSSGEATVEMCSMSPLVWVSCAGIS